MIRAVAEPAGNAVRLVFTEDAVDGLVRILRSDSAPPDDPADLGVVVFEGELKELFLFDIAGLTNGLTYHYTLFLHDGTAYVPTGRASASVLVGAWYQNGMVDVRRILQDRIEAGLQQEVARGLLRLKRRKAPDVLLGPPLYEDSDFPVISIHLNNDADADHGIGDIIGGIGDERAFGYLSRWSGQVVAWSQNPDERHDLYMALKRVLIANIPVFEGLLLKNMTSSFTDQDFISGEYPAPVYCATAALQFSVPSSVVVGASPDSLTIESTAFNAEPCC